MTAVTVAYLSVLEPDTANTEECPCCGFDALLTFPHVLVTDSGVSPFGATRMCARCWHEGCECCQRPASLELGPA